MVELALDCAANACSVAVARGGKLLASHWRRMERGHAEAAPVMLERAMADAGAAFPEISRIIVTRGPGSFTGIRIALAAARGLALVTGAEVAAVPTFEALRPAEPPDGRLFAVLDTKRGSLYAADLSGAVEPFVGMEGHRDHAGGVVAVEDLLIDFRDALAGLNLGDVGDAGQGVAACGTWAF